MSITINKEILNMDELEQLDKINKISLQRLKFYENINDKITKSNNELGFEYFKLIHRKNIICEYATYNIVNELIENIDEVKRWISYQMILKELTDQVFKSVIPVLNYNSYYKSVDIYPDQLCIDYVIEVKDVKYTIGFLCDKIHKIQVDSIILNTNWDITGPNIIVCIKNITPIIHQLNKIENKEWFIKFFDTSNIDINHFLAELETAVEIFNTIKNGVGRLNTIKTDIIYKNTKIYLKLYLQVGVINLEYEIDNINSLIGLLNSIQLDTK
jgi:hypothetical protein